MRLWKHQEHTIRRLSETHILYDASDAGVGKTLTALAHIKQTGRRTLVLAPRSLLVPAWLSDWEKIDSVDNAVVAWASNRTKAFEEGKTKQLTITNIDAVTWLARNLKYIKGFDQLIVDEATAFANHSAMRSKAARAVLECIPNRLLMSGTAMSKTVQKMWHQALLLDGGERLGKSITRFRYNFCEAQRIPSLNIVKWVDRPGASDAVAEAMADIMVRHKRSECMDIPANHVIWRRFDLPPALRKQYQQMEHEFVLELAGGKEVTALNAASKANKLLQIASGAVYDSDRSAVKLADTRYELIADIVESYEHSVGFYLWKHQREHLRKVFTKRKISFAFMDGDTKADDRAKIVNRFQAGELNTMFMHPETGAHGLTLTRGRAVIFAAPPVGRPDWLEQGIARIVRGGQTRETDTILIAANATVEGRVYDAIIRERDEMYSFLEYIYQLAK